MDKTITAVEMGSAFIPRQLVAAITKNEEEKMNYSAVKPYVKETVPDFTSQIRKFDSLMGGFALMNTVAIPPMNYSANYFSTSARFNRQISEYLEKSNRNPDPIFWDAFVGKETFAKLYPYLYKKITKEDLEEVALCYGLNRGYTAFANKYQAVTVKFKLDSKVDYNTIESLYQYAFNEVEQSYNFPYLDSWIPEYPQSATLFDKGYRLFDKLIIDIPPVDSQRPVSEKDRKDEWWERAKKTFHMQNEEALHKLRLVIEQRIKQEFQIEVTQKNQKIKELELKVLQLRNRYNSEEQKRMAYQS